MKTKPPIPLSTFTEARFFRLGDREFPAHRVKVDPSGYRCRVSLCGLVAPEGFQRVHSLHIRASERCLECERAAREAA